jgi:hypothetical protein
VLKPSPTSAVGVRPEVKAELALRSVAGMRDASLFCESMSSWIAQYWELVDTFLHNAMEASIDGGAVDRQAREHVLRRQLKERAANVPAATLLQGEHLAHS